MTAEKLAEILLTVPEFQPRALVLLREHQRTTGNLFPVIPRAERTRITNELNNLRDGATDLAGKLLKLNAIPLGNNGHPDVEAVFL